MRRAWRRLVTRDGVVLALEATVWGHDQAPPFVVASHATGFCKEVFHPVVDELIELVPSAEFVAFDHRAHGDSDVPSPPYDWWDLGRDVLDVLGSDRPAVGVGHSAGGAALVMAELLAPGTFHSLVLVEPIVFPGPYRRSDVHPLVEAAQKRRRTFPGLAAALQNFAGKSPFDTWDVRALEAYVTSGLAPDGDAWRLKCPPEAEAEFYRAAGAHGAWERLPEVGADVTLVAGEHSDSHPGDFVAATAERLGAGHVDVVPGASHFVVMESPARIAGHIAAHLERSHLRQPR